MVTCQLGIVQHPIDEGERVEGQTILRPCFFVDDADDRVDHVVRRLVEGEMISELGSTHPVVEDGVQELMQEEERSETDRVTGLLELLQPVPVEEHLYTIGRTVGGEDAPLPDQPQRPDEGEGCILLDAPQSLSFDGVPLCCHFYVIHIFCFVGLVIRYPDH